jgi:hypothetical protein
VFVFHLDIRAREIVVHDAACVTPFTQRHSQEGFWLLDEWETRHAVRVCCAAFDINMAQDCLICWPDWR